MQLARMEEQEIPGLGGKDSVLYWWSHLDRKWTRFCWSQTRAGILFSLRCTRLVGPSEPVTGFLPYKVNSYNICCY